MTSDDVAFLKSYNEKRSKNNRCSEDEFEEVIYFFEETTTTKQPYAALDNSPVLAYEELEVEFDETISESARRFAKDIYEHWKNQRLLKGNRPLMPSLKFETNLETDDADPYVCFRRREVRQVRKTRGRDAQVTEKLKKLRKELEEARVLMAQVKRREAIIREQLATDKQIFEQRTAVKELKRRLSIKGDDDELLITQKVCRRNSDGAWQTTDITQPAPKPKRTVDVERQRQTLPGMKPHNTRADGRLVDNDLAYLEEQQAKRTEAIDAFMEDNFVKHQKWNVGWVDATWRPITPPLEAPAAKSDFRTVFTESQLPTPPASVSEEEGGDAMAVAPLNQQNSESRRNARIRFATPPDDVPFHDQSRFRRRIGRGGRVMIDRRGVKRQKTERVDDRLADRWRFSGDSSEDEQVYPVDWTDNLHIRYRIMIERQGEKVASQQQASAGSNRRPIENHNRSASGHLLPPAPAAANSGASGR
jgi:enhancer of polycomb-like protein